MNQTKKPGELKQKFAKVPKAVYLAGAGLLLVAVYVFNFILPRTINFSYAGDNCRSALTFLPDQQKISGDSSFTIEYDKKVAGVVSTRLCVKPTSAPKESVASVQSSPFGLPVFKSNYQVKVDEPPQIVGSLTNAPIAIKKPVVFTIDRPDKIFNYSLEVEDKSQKCKSNDKTVECGINELELKQGDKYTLELMRDFEGRDTELVTTQDISILPAAVVVEASIKNDQTIFDKPKTFAFVLDKPITKATSKIEMIDGEEVSAVEAKTYTEDKTVTLALNDNLDREKNYRLTIESVEASDGSDLSQPDTVMFKTSGGPRVTGVNIGASGVDQNARVVVSLDQSIAPAVDITAFAKIEGVGATISKQGNQVIFALQGAPRCAPFTIRLNKGVTSETNGLTSKEDWAFSSRINCRATSVIGYSVRGKPIYAYYYGGGGTTILFTGGIHGSEPSGVSTMQGWINHLDANAHKIPANKQVVVVPSLNPDGIATGSRFNANNVNLGRNFPTSNWKSDIRTTSGVIPGGGGSAPLSEPESRAIANLTSQLRPRVEISFHAQGRLVGANLFADSTAIGNVYAQTVGYGTMYYSTEEIMGELTGEYEMWMGEKLGTPAILIELPSTSGNYFPSHQTALWKMVSL